MQEIELAQGECANPPLHVDVSDDSSFDFSDYYIDYDDDDYMHSDHELPICPKWADKTIQAVGDLVGDQPYSRKTISQFHNSFSTCELNISEKCFMMVVFYQENNHARRVQVIARQ